MGDIVCFSWLHSEVWVLVGYLTIDVDFDTWLKSGVHHDDSLQNDFFHFVIDD